MSKRDGAGILFVCTDDNTCLMLLRADGAHGANSWGIPGGTIEEGESPLEAASREVIEEVGSLPKESNYVDYKINTNEFNQKYHLYIYSISLNSKERWPIKLNFEHSDHHWFKIYKLPENIFEPIRELIK